MFTLFDDRLDRVARRILADHLAFDAGNWAPVRLAAHQLDALRATVRYAAENSKFYAGRLGYLRASDTELTVDSFAAVPFTTKQDLRDNGFDLLSRPVPEAWVFYETTGTTGAATPCPRDNIDSLHNNTALSICYRAVLGKGGGNQVVAVLGPSELHSTGDTFGDVCRNLGHAVAKMWPHSPVVGFPRALQLLRELRVSTVFCTPGMAISLAKEALAAGLDPARDFAVTTFMFTGEVAAPSLLKRIGEHWDANALNCLYASQEASVLGAVHGDGRMRTVPLNVFYELIHPDTGVRVEETDVMRGELVITHLYQGAKPLIRYRTGDLVEFSPPATGAAYPSAVMRPLGRVRDVLDLNGHEVSAYDLEEGVLSHLAGVLDYAISIERRGGSDAIDVTAYSPSGAMNNDGVAMLRDFAMDAWGTPVTVTPGDPGTITTTGAMVSWKAARVHDKRNAVDAEKAAAIAIAQRRDAR